MNRSRHAFPTPVSPEQADVGTSDVAGLSRVEWLATLKTASVVLVRNGLIHFRAQLTDATPCYLFIGKLKFHRIVGTLVKRQRVNRLNLLIVQTVEEST